jgi:hypothetical protein
MERVSEAEPSPREREARNNLELTALRVEGDRISGQVKGFTVTLSGDVPFHSFTVDLGAPLPISALVLQPGDLNHPDAVETQDGAFDEAFQVIAQPLLAPTVKKMLSAPVREELLRYFSRYPNAVLRSRTLEVRCDAPVTQAAVLDAVAIAQRLNSELAAAGFLEQEARAELPGEESLDAAQTHEHFMSRVMNTAVLVTGLGIIAWLGQWNVPLSVALGVGVAGVGGFFAGRVLRRRKR